MEELEMTLLEGEERMDKAIVAFQHELQVTASLILPKGA